MPIEDSKLIFWANQLTGFYMKATMAFNGLNLILDMQTLLFGCRGSQDLHSGSNFDQEVCFAGVLNKNQFLSTLGETYLNIWNFQLFLHMSFKMKIVLLISEDNIEFCGFSCISWWKIKMINISQNLKTYSNAFQRI